VVTWGNTMTGKGKSPRAAFTRGNHAADDTSSGPWPALPPGTSAVTVWSVWPAAPGGSAAAASGPKSAARAPAVLPWYASKSLDSRNSGTKASDSRRATSSHASAWAWGPGEGQASLG
jgi:hypothetical protein